MPSHSMPCHAPVVIRHGHIVVHCNDIDAVPHILGQLASISASEPARATATLKHHEEFMHTARQHGLHNVGALTSHLNALGGALARRARSSGRTRGAFANPDPRLAHAVDEALRNERGRAADSQVDVPPSRVWTPKDMCDDRVLRRPKVVKPLSRQRHEAGHLTSICRHSKSASPTWRPISLRPCFLSDKSWTNGRADSKRSSSSTARRRRRSSMT